MLESDGGVFRPTGFGFTGSDAARETRAATSRAARGIQADRSVPRAAAPTSARASRRASIPAMSLEVEGNYFLIHHTPADTVDKIDPMDMAGPSAAIAVMAYVDRRHARAVEVTAATSCGSATV